MSNNKYLAERLFDDFWGDGFPTAPMWTGHDPLYGKHVKNLMKTDVRETENSYELDIDLPGFQKEEMTVELRDGYLSIRAAKGLDKEEKDKKGTYIIPAHAAAASSLVMWSLRRCPLSMKTGS